MKDTRQSEAIKSEPSPKRESIDSGDDNGRSTLSYEYENMGKYDVKELEELD